MEDSRQARAGSAKEVLVQTAVDQIRWQGLTVGLEHISLEQVIKQSSISRATAYRHWPSKLEFLAEVLVTTVKTTRLEGESEEDVDDLLRLIGARMPEMLAGQGRRDLVVEALRRATDADFRRILASPDWRTYLALHATCQGLPAGELREEVSTALAQTEARFTAHRAQVYARLPLVLGYRLVPPLKPPDGFVVMADAAGAMMTGLVTSALSRDDAASQIRHMRAYGSSREADWSRESLHLVGVILSHIEPDPDVEWNAARLETSATAMAQLREVLRAQRSESSSSSEG